ncbi:MAG TPA: zinc-binding alcohol dehydrogenase family protein [Bacteroidota bacterium]|nr:zinc-binding alcohol dehydrogenase family protein [Bacteroidota bacterium]
MKAFAIVEQGVVNAIDIPEPVMGATDVLIDVRTIGLCGSDLNAYRGLMPFVTFPRIPGHEISGTIADKGPGVPASLEIGDRVTVLPYTNCGMCPPCRAGRTNCCQFNQTLGVQRDGALTERISVPFEKVFRSSTLSMHELALVEPMSVGYHGANRAEVRETDTVLLLGCGTIGMGVLCAAVRKGARVIALDINDAKLEMAKKFGASHTINTSRDNAQEVVMRLTQNEGVSVAIEAAGLPATFAMAVDLVAFAGRVVSIGYSKMETGIRTQLIVSKELDLRGSRNALRVFPSVISMFEAKEQPFTDLITRVFSFDEAPKAFAYWNENTGTTSKLLIDL